MLKLAVAALLTFPILAMNKSICGPSDDRVSSADPRIARALEDRAGDGGCTITMISNTCAISAGHCKRVLKVAEFNTPASIGGDIQHPEEKDIYDIDQESIQYKNNGVGRDWAVFKVLPNKVTGELAGEAQGFYQVTFELPTIGDMLRITGYGLDRSEPTKNLTQQTNTGALEALVGQDYYDGEIDTGFSHTVDTMGGNSGSSVLRESDDKIIGIHTHGGCSAYGGENQGTLISKHEELKDAIISCLASE